MKIKTSLLAIAAALVVPALLVVLTNFRPDGSGAATVALAQDSGSSRTAQDSGGSGFVITLKNGSSVKGRTLSRDQASGMLRLTMTQDASGQPKSYAMIAMDDADNIRVSSSDTDSIQVKVRGGTVINCKEFNLSPDTVTLKIGTRSTIAVPWDQIESISFSK